LANYVRIFKDPNFIKSYVNTLRYIAILVPSNVILSLAIAATLAGRGRKIQSIYRGAFYLPTVVGGVIIAAVWLWMYHPRMGLFNTVIAAFGGDPVIWLADKRFAMLAICVAVLTWTAGTSVIILLAGMSGISPELAESARIDGANSWQVFRRITLPMLKPVLVFVVTTQIINTFQIWEAVYMLTNGGPNNATISTVYYLYNTAFVSGKYGVASAQGVVLTCTILAFSWLSLKLGKELD
jgi:multiple sugar transport system permease protein